MPARTVIRDEALRLFAEYGADAVSLRQVAAAAGVSPGLVVHHFGGKDGLRAAVDEHAAGICEEILAATPRAGRDGAQISFTEALLRCLPRDSPVPLYLRRLLLAGDQAGSRIFRCWYQARRDLMDDLIAAGLARPGHDRAVRTAFLVVNDLAFLLLRDQLTRVLGADPLTSEGMRRWIDEALAIYQNGLLTGPVEAAEP